MKKSLIVKLSIYLVIAILIFIFHNWIMSEGGKYLQYVVGSVMILYGIDEIVNIILDKNFKERLVRISTPLLTILFGFITIFVIENNEYEFVILCVLWSSWSIMREFNEIIEKVVYERENKITALLNLLESLAVIVLSVLLMINPGEHHAHIHLILLGIELALEAVWPILTLIETKIRNNKRN